MRGVFFTLFLMAAPLWADPATEYDAEVFPLLERYCLDCHGDGMSKGDFSMDIERISSLRLVQPL